jgi:hypothetical protein
MLATGRGSWPSRTARHIDAPSGRLMACRLMAGQSVRWKGHAWARHRHSDNEKFRRDLNRPKICEMSEQPLKTLQDFPTSKLNTRVPFPSPAPSNFSDLVQILDLILTTVGCDPGN